MLFYVILYSILLNYKLYVVIVIFYDFFKNVKDYFKKFRIYILNLLLFRFLVFVLIF